MAIDIDVTARRIGPLLLLDSLQEDRRSDKGYDGAEQHHNQINSVKGRTGLIQIHQAKSATKMRQRKNLRHTLNERRQMFERSEGPGKNKDR